MKKNGISLIVLVITIIIMIILAAAIIITLNNTGIINTAEGGVEKTNNKQTRLELELVLADLQKEKYGDKKKITDAYIDETLIGKDMLVDGDVVIVQGWLYIIDREKLVVISDGEKAKLNKSINITTEATTTDYKTATITINISGIDNIKNVKIGNGTTETEITEIPEAVNGVYILTHSVTENGTYSVTVLDNNGGMNICSVVVDILQRDMIISSVEELCLFRDMTKAGADFSGKTITLSKDLDINSIENWEAIGSSTIPFAGTFNGNKHTIKNIHMNTTSAHQGFFGVVSGTIRNLTIEGEIITNKAVIGMIGQLNGGTVENCVNNASITSNYLNANDACQGGVVGRNVAGTIKYCTNNGKISGSSNCIGGVVGANEKSGNIYYCINNGEVIADEKTGSHRSAAGGIAAYARDGGIIQYCINTGNVTSNFSSVAGIVGNNRIGNVKDSYNTGIIKNTGKTEADYYTAGIVGTTYSGNTVENCYNIGSVSGTCGIAGVVASNEGTIKNCYYLDTCVTNGTALGISKTQAEMQTSAFANLLGTNWKFVENKNNNYPILSWQ